MLGKDYSVSSYPFGGKVNLDVRSDHKPNKYMLIRALNLLLLLLLFKKKKSKHERAKLRANIYQHLVGVRASRFQRMKEFIKEKINGFYCANLSKMSVC